MKQAHDSSKLVVRAVVDYLSESNQQGLLGQVTKDFESLQQKEAGADRAIICAPVHFSSSQVDYVKKFVASYLKVKLPVEVRIDKSLIAGFTLRVGEWFLDASIATQLHMIKNKISI